MNAGLYFLQKSCIMEKYPLLTGVFFPCCGTRCIFQKRQETTHEKHHPDPRCCQPAGMRHGFWPDCLQFQRSFQRSNRRERSFQRSCQWKHCSWRRYRRKRRRWLFLSGWFFFQWCLWRERLPERHHRAGLRHAAGYWELYPFGRCHHRERQWYWRLHFQQHSFRL